MNRTIVSGALALGAAFLLTSTAYADDAAAVWQKNCAKCHGKEGKGDTKMGQKLKIKDYTNADVQAKVTDEALTNAITKGRGDKNEEGETPMPAFGGKFDAAQIKALVAHIRTFKGKK